MDAGDKQLREILSSKFLMNSDRLLNEAVAEIKSHYYAKTEVDRVIDEQKITFPDWKKSDCVLVKDLKAELNKLGER